MFEIKALALGANQIIEMKFSSESYGIFGCNDDLGKTFATSRGIAIENIGPAKMKSANCDFSNWHQFRAHTISNYADYLKTYESEIVSWAESNPDLVAHSISDIVEDWANRGDFRIKQRPLIQIQNIIEKEWVVLHSYCSVKSRFGFYIGKTPKELGGYLRFMKLDEFEIL